MPASVKQCQTFEFTHKVVHLARFEPQDLYNTDTSDMNKSQS